MQKKSLLENIAKGAGLWTILGAELLLAGAITYAGIKTISYAEQILSKNIEYQSVNYLFSP